MISSALNKVSVVNLVLLVAFLALLAYLTINYAPVITQLVSEPEHLRGVIQSYGETGVLVFIAVQVLQVVISVIPGEVVQIAGGYLYGIWLGTFYLLIGLLIGSVLAFFAAKLLGYPVLKVFIPQDKYDKFRALLRTRKFEAVVFLLFLIPGLPKDLLTYAAGLVGVPPLKFFLIATGARLPALIGSAYIGANLQEQDYWTAGLLMVGALILFLIGYLFKDRLLEGVQRWSASRERQDRRKKKTK